MPVPVTPIFWEKQKKKVRRRVRCLAIRGSGVRKFLRLPLSVLLLFPQSVRAPWRDRLSDLAINGGFNVSFQQSIEASNKGSAERPQEPPGDRQGARRRADHAARSLQVGVIHHGRPAPLEAWLEPVRPQRVCGRPDGLPAQPAVRRPGVHSTHAAFRRVAAEPDRDPESRADGLGEYYPTASQSRAGGSKAG